MQSQSAATPEAATRAPDWGVIASLALGVAAFCAQARYLHVAEAANTDEGAMGEAGRLMLTGQMPHADFPWFHMPGLPLVIGVGLRLSIGMYGLRLLFLAANCLAVLPLYRLMQRLRPSRAAGLLAVFFFLTYHQMVHHDLRFLAVRQLANTLFISFLARASLRSTSRRAFLGQTALAVSSVMVFLPAAVNLAAGSLAAISWERDRSKRGALVRFYLKAGLVTASVVLAYFVLAPNSFQQVVLDQLGRAPVPRLQRLQMMLEPPDHLFYLSSVASLIVGLLSSRGLRPTIGCMLAMVAGSTMLGSNFSAHYPVLAAPAFSVGIYLLVLQIESLSQKVSAVHARALAAAVCLAVAAVQAWAVYEPLTDAWFGHKSPEHHALVRRIAASPGPLLTAQAIYGVEAGVPLLKDLQEIYLRSPILTRVYSDELLETAARKAGTILVEPRGLRVLSPGTQAAWLRCYPVLERNSAGIVLLVPHGVSTQPAGAPPALPGRR